MFTQKRRKDTFRLLLPKELIPKEINAKYARILKEARSFYTRPIDFLNESIQKVEVLGFNNATIVQQQSSRGTPLRNPNRVDQNNMLHMHADINYRSPDSVLKLIDRTLNIEFRHTLGNLNYFLLLESFLYQYSRDTNYIPDLDYDFTIELLNENGATYSKIVLFRPLIDGLDMLSFDNTSTVAQTESFKCVFKYNNLDYQFIETDRNTERIDLDDYLSGIEQNHPYVDPSLPWERNENRIPKFESNSPKDFQPGNVGNNMGEVLDDVLYHDSNNKNNEDDDMNNGGNGSGNNNGNNGNGNNSTGNGESFIEEIAKAKMYYSDKLAENEKFLYYPYEKDKDNKKKALDTYDNTKNINKDERSELDKWKDIKPSKFKG